MNSPRVILSVPVLALAWAVMPASAGLAQTTVASGPQVQEEVV